MKHERRHTMKIAQIAPLVERVPPKRYGGTERMVHALTEELVRRGHEVTLFASGDSITSAQLHSVYPRGLREARLRDIYGANPWGLLNIGTAYQMQEAFDIIHDHNGYISLPTANIARTPVLMTMHLPFTPEMRKIFRTFHAPFVATISQAQSHPAPDLHYAGTVYNGLSMTHYPFSETHDPFLLFVGRIAMDKGVHHAIEVSQELNLPLVIAAKLNPEDRSYFHEYVEPFLSDEIRWIGEVDEEERNKLMSKALCFLHPVTWQEPFGLTLIEAMACGCPVIAFDKGSASEIVKHGETGFVVRTIEEMLDAVENIGKIDRAHCREYVLKTFNERTMTDGYEAIYRKIVNKEVV